MGKISNYISLLKKFNPELASKTDVNSVYLNDLKESYNVMLSTTDSMLKEIERVKKHVESEQETMMFNSKVQPELTKVLDALQKTKSDIAFQKKTTGMQFTFGAIEPEHYNSIILSLNEYTKRFEERIEIIKNIC